jgi:hypothetical protein
VLPANARPDFLLVDGQKAMGNDARRTTTRRAIEEPVARGQEDAMTLWLRLYTEIINNPKVQGLPSDLFKTWINILCVAKIAGGILPTTPDLAFRLRCSEKTIKRAMDDLTSRRLIDEIEPGKFRPHDWGEHQYESDSSTERVRKYRAKHKGNVPGNSDGSASEANDGNVSETGEGNVSVTPQSRAEQIQSRNRTEEEQRRNVSAVPQVSPPDWRRDAAFMDFRAKYLATRGNFIDDDFAKAYQFGWKPLDWEQRAERMKSLRARIDAGTWADPRFVPKPEKFLKTEWKRPIMLPAKTKSELHAESWDRIGQQEVSAS